MSAGMLSLIRKSLNLSNNVKILLNCNNFHSIKSVTHVLSRNFDSTKVRLDSHDGDADVPQLKGAPEVDIRDVEKLVKNPPRIIILDVRKPEELKEEGNIPTAFNIPVDDLEDALKLNRKFFRVLFGFDKPDPDDLIVVYCRSGKRSTRAGQILLKNEFNNVLNYKGSWNEWSEHHPEDSLKKK